MMRDAKTAAKRFLKVRPQSTAEIKAKLAQKGFFASDIEKTVAELTAQGYLDDVGFTRFWINERLSMGFGAQRIIQELQDKSIEDKIIQEALKQGTKDVCWDQIMMEQAQKRWKVLEAVSFEKRKKRVLNFLLRRGFEVDLAQKVIEKL
ncbi:MAG: regulatory protein RecX [Candidatus Omnitrophica bacterium]|nr:regulatory protein RecX [Candidatus Omnitrophota bacterium]